MNVPARRKRRLNGLGFAPRGRPEFSTRLPFHVLFDDLATATGLRTTLGWPLNQNALPAASFSPLTGSAVSSTASGGGAAPRTGKVTVWKFWNAQLTVSPACTVTLCGKNSLAVACLGWPGVLLIPT